MIQYFMRFFSKKAEDFEPLAPAEVSNLFDPTDVSWSTVHMAVIISCGILALYSILDRRNRRNRHNRRNRRNQGDNNRRNGHRFVIQDEVNPEDLRRLAGADQHTMYVLNFPNQQNPANFF